jgi:hypothetical protein
MNITRHNYEEYFILYMDNELSSDERRMVEAFVQQHPDLKEELDLLFQYKLEPEMAITFTGKEELLKQSESNAITLTNYEEWLLLYTDNELSPEEKQHTTAFLAAHPTVQQELILLQKATLQPETILFPDKKLLYQKEEKLRRIPAIWWRVAAMLLLAIGLTTVVLVRNKKTGGTDGLAGIQKPASTTPANTTETKKENNIAVAINNTATKQPAQVTNPDKTQNNTATIYKNPLAKTNEVVNNTTANRKEEKAVTLPATKQPVIAITNKVDNNLPKPDNNPYISNKKEDTKAIAQNDAVKENNSSNNSLTKTDVTKKDDAALDIISTAFVDDANSSKKSKSRGLFRKLARTFEKRTNIDPTDDNGRLLVAGFAFKTK